MATTGVIAATIAAAQASSSYRVKFDRKTFLELVRLAKPKIIYSRKGMHFFSFDGFVMYSYKCNDSDFSQRILQAIEFSNTPWDK